MSTGARPYHRVDLDRTLKDAAVDLIGELGPAGFSLREVARRAGVSHAAPAHHFGDSRGLLTAIAIEAFETLDRAITTAIADCIDPRERFVLMARRTSAPVSTIQHTRQSSSVPISSTATIRATSTLASLRMAISNRSLPAFETSRIRHSMWPTQRASPGPPCRAC